MAFPLLAVIAAYAAGGSIVPHAAGGLIVSGAGGYIAGTYMSTAAITTFLAGSVTVAGSVVAAFTGTASALIGGTGVLGTGIGASGVTGTLASVGLVKTTPIIVPIAIVSVLLALIFGGYCWFRLRRRLKSVKPGTELMFTKTEAKMIEYAIKRVAKKSGS
jgi:hypothetical protein